MENELPAEHYFLVLDMGLKALVVYIREEQGTFESGESW